MLTGERKNRNKKMIFYITSTGDYDDDENLMNI